MDDWKGANQRLEEDMYQQSNTSLALFSSATLTFSFLLWGISLCGLPAWTNGKHLNRTVTGHASFLTSLKSRKGPSRITGTPISLLNLPRLKAEMLPPSSFPARYKVMPERNAPSKPNLNILYSTVQSTYWKSIICMALLSGTHGTDHCPRESFLH